MDLPSVTSRLRQLLARVLTQSGAGQARSPESIDPQAGFPELGVNSVDLLEFVLGLEDSFKVRVLDDMLPEDLPVNLAGWADLLSVQLKKSAA